MSQETFYMVQQMDLSNLETQLALQCAPLLTGIKMSNLFITSLENAKAVRRIFQKSRICCYFLTNDTQKAAFLLYRKNALTDYLQKEEVQTLLKMCGYESLSFDDILSTFRTRYKQCRKNGMEFPHEMGLLLGYPVEDVYGFIRHHGKNYLYVGYWKVYENMEEKKQIFSSYNRAKEDMLRFVANGNRIAAVL